MTNIGGFIGNLPGSQGTVTVSGTWTNVGTLVVGGLGTGTLTIQDGGTVSSGGGGSIGLAAGSTGTVTVTGPGSTWNNSPVKSWRAQYRQFWQWLAYDRKRWNGLHPVWMTGA